MKSILVTGANGGMGQATCRLLVNHGFSRIVMAGRSEPKVFAARNYVLSKTQPGWGVVVEAAAGFDMNDPSRIESSIKELSHGEPFDLVFLQAGGAIFATDFQTVEWNGKKVEKTVFQNVVGAHVTLSLLKKHNLLTDGVRVVFAGGEGARGIPGVMEKPNFATPAALRKYVLADFGRAKYNAKNAVGVSKFLGAIWVLKVAELEADAMSVIWFTPGLTYGTQGLDELPPVKRWVIKNVAFGLMRLLGKAQSPEDGARKFLDCLTSKIGVNGDLLGSPEGKTLGALVDQTPMNEAFSNLALREEFWAVLEEICGPFGS